MSLYQEWIDAKEEERVAVEKRRALEDQMAETFQLNDQKEGTTSIKDSGYTIKVVQRFNKTINADVLQDIANQEGLADQLSTLFRWKPEINKKVWDSADDSITRPLAGAITVKAGRPSFSITAEDK